MDKLAIIRSIVSVDEHSDSLVMTGYPERISRVTNHPSFGAVVSKLRSGADNAVPPFVSLRGMSRGTEPGFLGYRTPTIHAQWSRFAEPAAAGQRLDGTLRRSPRSADQFR
jgi:hypothetical protein